MSCLNPVRLLADILGDYKSAPAPGFHQRSEGLFEGDIVAAEEDEDIEDEDDEDDDLDEDEDDEDEEDNDLLSEVEDEEDDVSGIIDPGIAKDEA